MAGLHRRGKARAFDYYVPITTGDSTLSACVQGIMSAEVGYGKTALDHFINALYIDFDDTHGNTIDGVHITSAGGVWSSLVSGFVGQRDQGEVPHFDPRLPAEWASLTFHLKLRSSLLHIELDHTALWLTLREGAPLDIDVRGERFTIHGDTVRVPLAGDRCTGAHDFPERNPDGVDADPAQPVTRAR